MKIGKKKHDFVQLKRQINNIRRKAPNYPHTEHMD